MQLKAKKLTFFVVTFQILFIVLFALFVRYGKESLPTSDKTNPEDLAPLSRYYPMYQDVHVMIFIGFGFLMTFLKRYGYSSIGVNFLLATFVIEWATLIIGFFHDVPKNGYMEIDIVTLLSADFVAAAILISFGAVLGKLSPLQLLIMSFIEVALFQFNEYIGREHLHAVDAGDSIFVHAFGAYFGLAVARITFNDDVHRSAKEGASYRSDLFSMVGTVFLWIFWPSFNAGALTGDERHRAVLNTVYGIAASCVVSFAISALMDKRGRFNMVHIQNSTLAGGVAVGASANFLMQPWGALLIGSIAGTFSVVGFSFLTPFMSDKLKIHDTCGVNNLHGMPGVFAAIISAIYAAVATHEEYGDSLYNVFPMRAPSNSSEHGADWTAGMQAGHQLAAIAVTLGISIGGGIVTGILLKLPLFDSPAGDMIFDDQEAWEVAEDDKGYQEVAQSSGIVDGAPNLDI